MKIEIYTDGACSGNPGPGGAAAIASINGVKQTPIKYSSTKTTNQQMELMAAILALNKYVHEYPDCEFKIYSDSAYLVTCWKDKWWKTWKENGWLNSKKMPVANRELWEELIPYFSNPLIQFIKVKGHIGNPLNEEVDKIAVMCVPKNIVKKF